MFTSDESCSGKTFEEVKAEVDYQALREVLDSAFNQAAFGKGKARHANYRPFDEQPIIMLQRLQDTNAGVLFQAMKKILESERLPYEAAVKELLGAIVYTAAAVQFLMEKKERS